MIQTEGEVVARGGVGRVGVLFDFFGDEQRRRRRNGPRNLMRFEERQRREWQKLRPLLGRQSALFVLSACLRASVFTLDLTSG